MGAAQRVRQALVHGAIERFHGVHELVRMDAGLHRQRGQGFRLGEHRMRAEGLHELFLRPLRKHRRRFLDHLLIRDDPEALARLPAARLFLVVDARMVFAHEALAARVDEDFPDRPRLRMPIEVGVDARRIGVVRKQCRRRAEIQLTAAHVAAGIHAKRQALTQRVGMRDARGQHAVVKVRKHARVGSAAAGGEADVLRHVVGQHALVVLRGDADDCAGLVLDQIDRPGLELQIDLSARHVLAEQRLHGGQDRFAAVLAPLIARHREELVAGALHRMIGQHLEPVRGKPVERVAGIVDEHARDHWIGRPAVDAHVVFEVDVGAVDDALGFLEHRARCGHLSAGTVERAAEDRRLLDHQNLRAAIGGKDRRRHAGGARADHNQIVGRGRSLGAAPRRQHAGERTDAHRLEERAFTRGIPESR